MKKSFMTLAAVLCCIMTMGLMNSCKEEKQQPTPPTPTEEKQLRAEYMFQGVEALRTYCDVTIEYYDSVGNIKSELLTQDKWEMTFWSEMPCKIGMRVSVKLKEGVGASTVPAVDLSYSYKCMSLVNVGVSPGIKEEFSPNLREGEIAEWIEDTQNDGGLVNYLITFDMNGRYTEGKWK